MVSIGEGMVLCHNWRKSQPISRANARHGPSYLGTSPIDKQVTSVDLECGKTCASALSPLCGMSDMGFQTTGRRNNNDHMWATSIRSANYIPRL